MRNRINRSDIVVYNDEKIRSWENEAERIPLEIDGNEKAIYQATLIIFELNTHIYPIEGKICQVEAGIAHREQHLREKAEYHAEKHHNGKNILDNLDHLADALLGDSELNALKREKECLIKEKAPFVRQKNLEENYIDELNNRNDGLRKRQEFITYHIPKAQNFMRDLRNNPEAFYRRF